MCMGTRSILDRISHSGVILISGRKVHGMIMLCLYGMNLTDTSYAYNAKKAHKDCGEEQLFVPVMTEEAAEANDTMLIPAKIMCFVRDQNDDLYAVIHSCHEYHIRASVLTYRWQFEYAGEKQAERKLSPFDSKDDISDLKPVYHAVSVEALQKHCLIIPFHKKSRFVMQVIDQDKWPLFFSHV